ncbi:PAS domain-containing protein, partial [Dapis sp. BLCC M126]|uniref:PAS domain-containing protein n=1 Tax=Dapis sp. BLCC M126 TaxID=3400189 RepID=UPI003CE9DE13
MAFGGLGFVNAISTLLAAIAYQISETAIHQLLFNAVFSMQVLSGACLVLFVANYTDFKPMKLPYLISMGYVISLVILWQALLFNNPGANKILESELPWGETISIIAQTGENLQNPIYLLDLMLNGFNLFACYRHFRQGHRQSAIFLGIGLIFFILVYIHTVLVDIGLLKTFYLLEFSYLPLVLIINAQIVSRILQLGIVQQALKTSEKRWRSLVETVNLVIISRDRQAQTQYVNPYFSQLTGFQPEEIKGYSWFESMSPPADRIQQTKDFWSLYQGHDSLKTQSRLMTKTGDILTLEWSHVPIYNRDGAIVEFVSIGADITQRLKAEEELAIYRTHLVSFPSKVILSSD